MKQKILDNVAEYSAEQLVKAIRQGIVTFDELVQNTDGEFTAEKRKQVKQLLESGDADEWAKVQQEATIEAAQNYLDTFPKGQFRDEARQLKAKLEKEKEEKKKHSQEEHDWECMDKSSPNALNAFLRKYPISNHTEAANQLINDLLYDEIMNLDTKTLVNEIYQISVDGSLSANQKVNSIINRISYYLTNHRITKEAFLNELKEDNNLVNADTIRGLITQGIITYENLLGIGIERVFLQYISKAPKLIAFPNYKKFEKIERQSTEIYFWGIPSSGKSCALGAILSVASGGRVATSMDDDTAMSGYGYMTTLIEVFKHGEKDAICLLPSQTQSNNFYAMGFDLTDSKDRIHPITCIDMAGELMRSMYLSDAGRTLSQQDNAMLTTLSDTLRDNRSVNRKMHFFVIEYGGENRLYDGYSQATYLKGAMSYIKRTNIFQKDTDAIYIMITKADKIKNPTPEVFNQYIEQNYNGFFQELETICKRNGINGGRVEKIAFSLGKVCFQDYCKLDTKSAENVVRILLDRSASFKGGKIGSWMRLFNK